MMNSTLRHLQLLPGTIVSSRSSGGFLVSTLSQQRKGFCDTFLPLQRMFFHSTATNAYSTSYEGDAVRGSGHGWHGTTIICVRKNGKVCMIGDGMVSQGNMIVKPNAKKIRRILPKTTRSSSNSGSPASEGTIVGFAGSTADAFTLLERLEGKLDEYPGQLARSCVELAKGWRTDKYLRRLEASLLVADKSVSLELTGNGDVLESHDGVLGVGSGSPFAIAAARALMDVPELSAQEVGEKAMKVASSMCVFTNDEFLMEIIENADDKAK